LLALESSDRIVLRSALPRVAGRTLAAPTREGVADASGRAEIGPEPTIAGKRVAAVLVNDRHLGCHAARVTDLLDDDRAVGKFGPCGQLAALQCAQRLGVDAHAHEWLMRFGAIQGTLRHRVRV